MADRRLQYNQRVSVQQPSFARNYSGRFCGGKCRRSHLPVNNGRIAKHIVISLDNGLSIVWHLGMSGGVQNQRQSARQTRTSIWHDMR
ncbi:MAG: DNA-formamidopyrimidine glycosylase family protein [Oscillospiraceae bacterium]